MPIYKNKKNYLSKVLCSGCGICTFICREKAIIIVKDVRGFYPEINEGICTQCGLCSKSCPIIQGPLNQAFTLNKKNEYTVSELIGNYQNSFVGYCIDNELRSRSSSGGIVTALLVYMLKAGVIDGAVVVVQNPDHKSTSDLFTSKIARTEEEIFEAQGSKYIQVSMENALIEIIHDRTLQTICIVGTGCQIRAIKMNIGKIPEIRDRVFYFFGLFCKQNKTPEFTNYLLDIVGHDYKKKIELHYRDNGWSNFMLSINGEKKLSRKNWEYGFLPWYLNAYGCDACLACSDCTAEEADISLGDAWLPQYEIKNDSLGYSVFFTRSKSGDHLIQEMLKENRIIVENIDPLLIAETQSIEALIIKKSRAFIYGWIFNKKARIQELKYLYAGKQPFFLDMINALNYLLWSHIFAGKIFRKLIIYFDKYARISFLLVCKINRAFDKIYLSSYKIKKSE